jgi:hypothetical protein
MNLIYGDMLAVQVLQDNIFRLIRQDGNHHLTSAPPRVRKLGIKPEFR